MHQGRLGRTGGFFMESYHRIPFANSTIYGTDVGERIEPDTTTMHVLSEVRRDDSEQNLEHGIAFSIGTAQNARRDMPNEMGGCCRSGDTRRGRWVPGSMMVAII